MDSDEKKCTRCSVIIPIFFVMDICMECEIELQKKEIINLKAEICVTAWKAYELASGSVDKKILKNWAESLRPDAPSGAGDKL